MVDKLILSQATVHHIAHPPNWWFSVINSISRNLSELGLKIQQFQSYQGRSSCSTDGDLVQFYQRYLLTQEDKSHPLQGCTVRSVPASKKHTQTHHFCMKNRYSRQYH